MARAGGNPDIGSYKKDYYTDKVLPKWEMIAGWARSGLTDPQIAKNCQVGVTAFKRYLEEYEEFAEHVRTSREDATMLVENALFKRAIGYESVEVTKERRDVDGVNKLIVVKKVIKQIAPDVNAAQYWLEHRAPNKWTRNPVAGLNIEDINTGITGLALLLTKPVPVREIGSEVEDV